MDETSFNQLIKVLTDADNIGYSSKEEMRCAAIGFFEVETKMSKDQIAKLHEFIFGGPHE